MYVILKIPWVFGFELTLFSRMVCFPVQILTTVLTTINMNSNGKSGLTNTISTSFKA